MDNTACTDHDVIAKRGSLEDYAVHPDETIISDADRRPLCMLFVQVKPTLLRVKRVKVIVDNLTVGTDSGIFSNCD